jgi:hypothetical protein
MENRRAAFAIEAGRYHFRVPGFARNAKNEIVKKQ